MPLYAMTCGLCGKVFDMTHSIHEPLPTVHAGCGGPLVQIIHPPALTGVSTLSSEWAQSDREFDKDAAAYRRMRAQGLQPQTVNGSAELETKAASKFEVERNMIVEPKGLRKRFETAHTEADR